jgi:hypothetical protein
MPEIINHIWRAVFVVLRELLPVIQHALSFLSLHVVQAGYGVHPISYPLGTGSSFPRSEAAGA